MSKINAPEKLSVRGTHSSTSYQILADRHQRAATGATERRAWKRGSGWAKFKKRWKWNGGMSEWLSNLPLFYSNFPNSWEPREPERNSYSVASICYRWIFVCQQPTSLELSPSSAVSVELDVFTLRVKKGFLRCSLVAYTSQPRGQARISPKVN